MSGNNWQSIFNRDFYPTPVEVIEQMLSMTDVAGKIVLEPSFGSGNIVKYLNDNFAKQVIGCEINDRLRSMVEGVSVIGSDFLRVTSEEVSHIDMIVMNPPFSNEEEHILHAWDIAPGGCEIISLCNASLIGGHGYYSNQKREKVNNLIDLYGHSEDLGDVFKDAERKTDCKVAVIRLYKPGEGNNEFDGYFTDEADEPEVQGYGLITYNFVRECVNRYVSAVGKLDGALAAAEEINNLTSVFQLEYIKLGAFKTTGSSTQSLTKDEFRKALQKRAWHWIFAKFDMSAFVTTSVMEKINAFVERQSSIPFTMKNIYRMVEMIYGTREQIMQQVVLDAFDIISQYSEDNVTYVGEKWKTNSAHMVNKKFIIPYICTYESYGYKEPFVRLSYFRDGKIDDIVKALCYIGGTPYQWKERDENGKERKCSMRSLNEFVSSMKMSWGEWYDWTFFRIKAYKKGTMHFEFQNDDIWALFNQSVAKVRGWELPANVKVKKGAKK